ncbi:AraC family transcriptional regulator [Paucilactobacillus hokkaidonensis JCM 18461]|uniref:AraC family transcriptional regulator n=2 Tax=Paucilactobacillus hokkaidonensis TaxID=1193095 RepID=A0A0A1GWJ1_9LACO|nr:AraC family transcriptional regulator [Paucilactobacillus hokkaidonensis]KRO09853.1 AraC family transcriptional regulator [Paucilactobacillus hokkaidonensis]BAP84741.1 AraC family transcriptional regulator [Paucilactobacillus hokkaidonensis JCM 18461]
MAKFVPLPSVESSLRLFGGHMRTVAGGWSFFEQKHQAFELMCVIEGHQTTQIGNLKPVVYGPGDALIISPGTLHINFNTSSTEPMTYICFHFNIESLELKSEIISSIANTKIDSTNELAQTAVKTAKEMVTCSADKRLNAEELNLRVQIILLNFLYFLTHNFTRLNFKSNPKYSEREAKVARSVATIIENSVEDNPDHILNISQICHSLNISSGYGHRVFKKVYGITPLHFVEEQKYRKAKLLLGSPEYSIEEISYMTGSNSLSNFSKQFKKWSGLTPSKYQQQVLHKRKVTAINKSGYFE